MFIKQWAVNAIDKARNWTESAIQQIPGAFYSGVHNTENFIDKAVNWTESTGGELVDETGNFIDKTGNSTGSFIDSFWTDNDPTYEIEYTGSELWPSDTKFWYMLSWVLLCGLIGLIAFPLSMIAIGFTVDGVTALSCAACTQSCVYGGATRGCFSIFQALGTMPHVMVLIGFIFGSVFGGLIANSVYDNHFENVSTNSTISFSA